MMVTLLVSRCKGRQLRSFDSAVVGVSRRCLAKLFMQSKDILTGPSP